MTVTVSGRLPYSRELKKTFNFHKTVGKTFSYLSLFTTELFYDLMAINYRTIDYNISDTGGWSFSSTMLTGTIQRRLFLDTLLPLTVIFLRS